MNKSYFNYFYFRFMYKIIPFQSVYLFVNWPFCPFSAEPMQNEIHKNKFSSKKNKSDLNSWYKMKNKTFCFYKKKL